MLSTMLTKSSCCDVGCHQDGDAGLAEIVEHSFPFPLVFVSVDCAASRSVHSIQNVGKVVAFPFCVGEDQRLFRIFCLKGKVGFF